MTTRKYVEAECERHDVDIDDVHAALVESQQQGGHSVALLYDPDHPNYWPLMAEAVEWLRESRAHTATQPGAQSAYYARMRRESLT